MKYIFIELKTTGLDPDLHTLIQLTAIVQINGLREGEFIFQARPLPKHKVDDSALTIANFTQEQILQFPEGKQELEKFQLFLQDFLLPGSEDDRFIIIGYNVSFIVSFLENFFIDYQSQNFYSYFKSQPIDLYFMVQQYFQDKMDVPSSFKKTTVLNFFPIPNAIYNSDLKQVEHIYYVFNKISPSLKQKASLYIDLDTLNIAQRQSVETHHGALLVLAGAGSGKTRVITYKIAYLISTVGINPAQILAVTFTNKAAKEMKERVSVLIGKNLTKTLTLSTFHSLGLQILKEEYVHLEYTKEFSIFGESEREALLKESLLELKYSEDDYAIKYLSSFISSKKNQIQKPKEIAEIQTPLQDIYQLYEDKLKLNNAFDFDDLIFKPLCLFFENPQLREKWGTRYLYILVDEYQDTNYSQYQLIKVLSWGAGNICAVGDDDQSIYAFRGADITNILAFEKDFVGAKRIVLNYNYRNSEVILKASTALISNNPGRHTKEVFSGRENSPQDKILLHEAYDQEGEAQWIASEIFTNRIDRGISYNDQAILCRTNAQMRIIEKALRQDNIRYHIIGGFSFFDRAEVKIIFAYLRLLHNPQDNQAFYRVVNFPKRGIGDKTLDAFTRYAQEHNIGLLKACAYADEISGVSITAALKLKEFAQTYWVIHNKIDELPLSQVIGDMYQAFSLQDELTRIYKDESAQRIHSLMDIQADIFKKERRYSFQNQEGFYPLSQYLQETILSQLKDDEVKEEEQKVLLITIHSAKGLEFQAVFIPGFQEGIFPHERSLKEGDKGIEEERRLGYVAFTRAQNYLFLSYSQYRKVQGEDREQQPSRFLQEISEEYLLTTDMIEIDGIQEIEKMRKMLQTED